jgi:hypothetical protein
MTGPDAGLRKVRRRLADHVLVWLGHVQRFDLLRHEQPQLLVLVGKARGARAAILRRVGDDEDVPVRLDRVDPGARQSQVLDGESEFFVDFAPDRVLERFADLKFASGQFPFVALVAQ